MTTSDDNRLAHFTTAAKMSLPHWGIKNATIALIKYRENAVFKVTDPNGQCYALRLHRPGYHEYASLLSELQWMDALSEYGIATAEVVRTTEGELVARVVLPATGEDIYVDLFHWVDGEVIGSVEDGVALSLDSIATLYYNIGEIAAQLHNQSSTWTLPEGFTRHAWDLDGLLGEAPLWGRFWELELLTEEQKSIFIQMRNKATELLQGIAKTPANYGLIHADFVPENLMLEQGRLRPIDFDDAGFGWYMFELATVLYFIQDEPYFEEAKTALFEGYRAKRTLPDEEEALLPLFLVLRSVTYVGWLRSRQETQTAKELAGDLIARALRQSEQFFTWFDIVKS
ncbi:phosphotransferase enzyme family protein [Alteromonas gilva]|uniref:Phosphotransferase n=1 Tax=Alteromonas gilva TaxID=2987522 RepID=A0ABT5KZR7_9ALTE|nr:phosphotransferase [Alteromonas gilva]MDC8830268.1 phosphotransferase [Alteromonas gilva]